MRAFLASFLVLLAASAGADIRTGGKEITRIVYGSGVEICKAYLAGQHDPIWSKPGVTHATIASFGARVGSNPKQRRLTLRRDTDLPASVTISAAIANGTTWNITRFHSGGSQQVAAGLGGTSAAYIENLSASFRPPASGWTYLLAVSASDACGAAHASVTVRTIAPPTLTAFTATAPGSLQAPGIVTQVSYLTWTAAAGDPAATWAMTQTGHVVDDLPSPRILTPEAGRATGALRVHVTVQGTPGARTTLTLTGTNEAGSVSRSVSIDWQ